MGKRDSSVGRAIVLHTARMNLIPSSHRLSVPSALPGMIPLYRARSKPEHRQMQSPNKQKIQFFNIFTYETQNSLGHQKI